MARAKGPGREGYMPSGGWGYVKGTCPRATCPGEGEGYMPGEGGLHAQGGHVNIPVVTFLTPLTLNSRFERIDRPSFPSLYLY